MAQIFRPRANAIVRGVLIGAPAVVAVVLAAVGVSSVGYWGSGVGRVPEQPVPFSHKHHVGALGLDCRYCHTSVETSAFAGLPPTSTCMTCHSQLWTNADMLAPVRQSLAADQSIQWTRVYDLPDYVYFNHSAHVNHGVACESCHGRVDKMPLTRQEHAMHMGFCLACHRDPGPHLRPENRVFEMGWDAPADRQALGKELLKRYHTPSSKLLTDCYTCHR
jgi:hypothetical protein